MSKKIIIIGSSSNLAKQLCDTLDSPSYNIKKISRIHFDYIHENKKLSKIINKFKPKIIINCAAVVKSEDCNKKPIVAYEVNSYFPHKLCVIAKKINATFIHFSTDAVFDGNKKSTYDINDETSPTTIYGKSKLLGEKFIIKYKKTLIIRLSLLFGKYHQNQIVDDLLKKLIKNKKVYVANDIYCTPTYSKDVANFLKKKIDDQKINELIKKRIIHLSSNKRLSVFNFVKKISKKIDKVRNVIAVKDSYFNKFKRPKKIGLKASEKNFYNSNLDKFLYDMKIYKKN